jgi:hypothetical protein
LKGHNWRWWFHVFHRDLGYLCVGLVLIYAVSGIAVNHIDDWNPNYSITHLESEIGPIDQGGDDAAKAMAVLGKLGAPPNWRTLFRPEPGKLSILRDGHTVDVELATGKVYQEWVESRAVIYETNRLHLNHHKHWWTLVADIFAGALIVLAITGMFLIKGKKGLKWRGAKLVAVGFAVPLFFLWFYG